MSTKITLHLNTEGQIVLNLLKYLANYKLHVITCNVSEAQNMVNTENYSTSSSGYHNTSQGYNLYFVSSTPIPSGFTV